MPEEPLYKVKVTVGDATVEIEGPKAGAVELLAALTKMLQSRPITGPEQAPFTGRDLVEPTQEGAASEGSTRSDSVDIRSFFEEKGPSSDIEAAAAAAFFYQYVADEGHRKEVITAEDLTESFRLARRQLPRAVAQTLRNAKNAGYLDSAGESGHYKLNPVGYNLVEHTLGSEAPARRTPRKKTTRKSTARKKTTKKASKKKTAARRSSKKSTARRSR